MRPSKAVLLLSISLLTTNALTVRDSRGLQISHYHQRGILDGKPDDTKPGDTTNPDPGTDTTTTATESSTTTTSESSTTTASSTTTTTSETSTTTSTTTSATETSTSAGLTNTPPPPDPTGSSTDGQSTPGTDTVTTTQSSTDSSASPSPSAGENNTNTEDKDSGVSTGTIVGLSIAGGVALIGIVGFFVWKFTRKRMADFDDNEAIKWPELNTHGGGGTDEYPLPTNRSNQAGYADSEVDLSRTASNSTGYGRADPYAVPPLPHMNPNQPYQDDPGSAYYDPYQGPVPHTLETQQTGGAWPGEVIAMNQMRTGSPAPPMGYDNYGRSSPAPMMGRASPAPPMAMYPADNMNRARSPGPNMAYHQ